MNQVKLILYEMAFNFFVIVEEIITEIEEEIDRIDDRHQMNKYIPEIEKKIVSNIATLLNFY